MHRRRLLSAAAAAAWAGCAAPTRPAGGPTAATNPGSAPRSLGPSDAEPPAAPREWRAAWVASVAHIDWPARAGSSADEQRDTALQAIERAAAIGLNALILQVRPAGDALYPSALEPWSEYLTGAQGRAPDPAWDPLQFWADECHRRGLELHAWLNPYRARHPSAQSPLAHPHLATSDPDAVVAYGDLLWMDPGHPRARQRTLAVAADLLQRYDVDGLHIDDYFYPYPVRGPDGNDLPFPDDDSFARDARREHQPSRADWRREQVDTLVRALHGTVRDTRPQAGFGVSPFGLMRADRRPAGIVGFDAHERLYAHVEHWLSSRWMDYVVPQLYWKRSSEGQAFEALLDAWLALTPRGVSLRAGLFSSRVGAERNGWEAQEIVDQIDAVRRRAGADGHVHFSLSALVQDRAGLATALRAGPYAQRALAPARPRALSGPGPAALSLERSPQGLIVVSPMEACAPGSGPPTSPGPCHGGQNPPVAHRGVGGRSSSAATGEKAASIGAACCAQGSTLGLQDDSKGHSSFARFASAPSAAHAPSFVLAVWRRQNGLWRFDVQPAHDRLIAIDSNTDAVALSAVDRQGREGPRQTWTMH